MAGMITSIAGILRSGNATQAEIVDRIGITCGQLMKRLPLMERQWYIVQHPDVNLGLDSLCSCWHRCSSCCLRDAATVPVLYALTEKGELLARDAGDNLNNKKRMKGIVKVSRPCYPSENVPYFPPPPGCRVTLSLRRAETASATFGWITRISASGTSRSTAISLPNAEINEA